MDTNLAQKLRKLLSKSREINLNSIQLRNIDRFLKSLPDVHWRPDCLLYITQNKRYLAFNIIYDADSFPNNLSGEIEKAISKCNLDFFFILENDLLLGIFEENCRAKGFGIILNKGRPPLLIRDAMKSVIPSTSDKYMGHYPPWIIEEIRIVDLGNSQFRTALRDFSTEYVKLKTKNRMDWQKEENLVKSTIAQILSSDKRYTGGASSLEILSRFEKFWYDIRDHYFHSFHVFLLGLLILNRYKDIFVEFYKNTFPRYKHLRLEFVWLLTSIFHDVGYPITKIDVLKEDIFGIPTVLSEKELSNVWDDPIYKENLKQLVSLFKFSFSTKKHKIDWHPEVFGTEDTSIEQIFRELYYESHGVAGCFRFLVDIFAEGRREEDIARKIFLINHIYPAAVSIALHDIGFREKLRGIGFKKVKLSRFPFAVLLIYLDSLQEDRRDKFLSVEVPDLIEGLVYNGKVLVRVNESFAKSYPRIGKLKAECRNFKHFVECDGIKFEYPKVLVI